MKKVIKNLKREESDVRILLAGTSSNDIIILLVSTIHPDHGENFLVVNGVKDGSIFHRHRFSKVSWPDLDTALANAKAEFTSRFSATNLND